MFQDTRPAELDSKGDSDPWGPFRVASPADRLSLLRALRDRQVPVVLSAPEGTALSVSLWAVDEAQDRLNFSVDARAPQLPALVDVDEAVAVAYLDSVKLQFDLHGLTLVRGAQSSALQCAMPQDIYRFQRRSAYRVRPRERQGPVATFRHPALPEMPLALRVLDVSIGGCALWLPGDVPPLQAGTLINRMHVELDPDTEFESAVRLQHVSGGSLASAEPGVRIGCEWQHLSGPAERVLQRWIDRSQRRRHLLTLG
ncbi:flagellar brake protein [Rubrivivax rivuli]|uniref:Flagellar brake protein n=1 Tax=Rubrivivax rivuli TaxID=1862385 RepID=A0A437RIJ3_9BURK|nr:flagellar brake protein [Rubrivivax rivuli]RVU46600.1 flagellar brake protein [Rubrivivax rivuli]